MTDLVHTRYGGRSSMQYLSDIRRVMAVVMAVSADEIRPETVPNDLPAWDSLSHITLVVALEQELGICFTTAEIERMTKVAEICRIVAARFDA